MIVDKETCQSVQELLKADVVLADSINGELRKISTLKDSTINKLQQVSFGYEKKVVYLEAELLQQEAETKKTTKYVAAIGALLGLIIGLLL